MPAREAAERPRATPDTVVDQDRNSGAPLLVFVHIPKTAGTTLTSILRMNEPGPRSRRGGNVFKGGGGVKRGIGFDGLLTNASGQLDRARLLTGHFPLAIREHLPEDRDVRFLTLLREPADRTLSHYFAIRDRFGRREGTNKLGLPPLSAEATLDEALAAGYLHDNVQTRMLSGLSEPFGEVDEAMLEEAKHNLREGLAFVGLTERFDESLVLVKQRLGLGVILPDGTGKGRTHSRSSGRINTTRPRGDEVPQPLRRAAERCNRFDSELYRYAEQLFEAAPERQRPDFEIELAALRASRTDGDIDLDTPPPEGYTGDRQSWKLLLHARATLLRQELEFARLRAVIHELAQRDQDVMASLERIYAAGKSTPGRDAETALRVMHVLAPQKSTSPANGASGPEADAANKLLRRSAAPKGRRNATRALVKQAPEETRGATGEAREDAVPKRRNRGARKPRDG